MKWIQKMTNGSYEGVGFAGYVLVRVSFSLEDDGTIIILREL